MEPEHQEGDPRGPLFFAIGYHWTLLQLQLRAARERRLGRHVNRVVRGVADALRQRGAVAKGAREQFLQVEARRLAAELRPPRSKHADTPDGSREGPPSGLHHGSRAGGAAGARADEEERKHVTDDVGDHCLAKC